MCFGGSTPKAQTLPPTPPVAAQMADPAVQQARNDTINRTREEGGLATTQLNINLGGQGQGAKKLAGGTSA